MTEWVNPKYAEVVEQLRAARCPDDRERVEGYVPTVRGFLMSDPVADADGSE